VRAWADKWGQLTDDTQLLAAQAELINGDRHIRELM